ncbi:HAMP domain-containing sensor histidine kinase [Rudaeicoccus suwonensis]|uniref:histidine kinase n=1 Tax=Rudaeicoccus suwonensis TaxID=657409 RepID=A0A561E7S6_9MICO|nr:HAMP domain-containing sensor histidine kinase [Rudaeicoccus suwonensis]TWE11668.1 two-component system sensor histidine kinase BaeS [Rudaeicoccus suwonensis]
MRLRLRSLTARLTLLAVVIAVITGLLAAAIAYGLIQREAEARTKATLSRLADAAQATTDLGSNPDTAQRRARRLLEALDIQFVTISRSGVEQPATGLAARSLTATDKAQLLAGERVSGQRRINGRWVLIQGRPTSAGAIVLAQRRSDAAAAADDAIVRLLWGILIAVVVAVVLGVVFARRLSRPLRTTASVAAAIERGERAAVAPTTGPSEIAEVGAALNSLAGALAGSEQRQRDFLLSVSHDLRTPLTAITGYAESLADGVVPAEETAVVGATMLGESQRLRRMVDDLLDLARLDARELRIDPTDIEATAFGADTARVWAARCAAEGVSFAFRQPPPPIWLRSDPTRIRQILDGLFDNALRVTPVGKSIVLQLDSVEDQVVFEVRDGGPGLSDEDLDVAFERAALYERYRGIRPVGTGLGLAIVHALTTRLGGRVEAGHAPEGGARFTVRLPQRMDGEPRD